MNKIDNGVHMLAVIICLFMTAGCAATAAPTFYQLEKQADKHLSSVEHGLAIGVRLIKLADYLDRPQIVTHIADNNLCCVYPYTYLYRRQSIFD